MLPPELLMDFLQKQNGITKLTIKQNGCPHITRVACRYVCTKMINFHLFLSVRCRSASAKVDD